MTEYYSIIKDANGIRIEDENGLELSLTEYRLMLAHINLAIKAKSPNLARERIAAILSKDDPTNDDIRTMNEWIHVDPERITSKDFVAWFQRNKEAIRQWNLERELSK